MVNISTFYCALWALMVGSLKALPFDEDDNLVYGVTPGRIGTNCSCGWSNKAISRIINGKDSGENEWPMMAGIIARTGSYVRNNLICGGTLITRKHVVTAAHCVHTVSGIPAKPDQLSIVLGAHRLSKIDYDNPAVMRKPEKFISHPKYKFPVDYDLAIVVLQDYVEYSRIIGPACLPTGRINPLGKPLTAIGWGFMDFKATKPDVLQKTELRVVKPTFCFRYKEFNLIEGYQYCTHQGDHIGQCVGDSGGPILWRDPDTNRYTLVAAPSFSSAGCVLVPAVVSDISYYVPWIQQVISDTYPEERSCSKMEDNRHNNENTIIFRN